MNESNGSQPLSPTSLAAAGAIVGLLMLAERKHGARLSEAMRSEFLFDVARFIESRLPEWRNRG
jgi:hypothetical protein